MEIKQTEKEEVKKEDAKKEEVKPIKQEQKKYDGFSGHPDGELEYMYEK